MAKNEPQTKNLKRWQLACSVLLISFFAAAGWAMYQERNYEVYIEQRFNEYPLLDPARNFVAQEDFIVNIQPLREKLHEIVADFEAEGGDASLYLEFLNTGANISINQNKYLFPASLTKVPIALVAMNKIEKGEWALHNELVLMENDIDLESGDPQDPVGRRVIGSRFTVEYLLKELLMKSDNTAGNILKRNFSDSDVSELVNKLGLSDLFTEEGRYSAKEYARFFRTLYTSSFLAREHSQRILSWLDEAAFNEFLSHSIPQDVPFPHKYGSGALTVNSYYSDAGVVYIPHRPYLIAVMVQGERSLDFEERATVFMREVSEEAYQYFLNHE